MTSQDENRLRKAEEEILQLKEALRQKDRFIRFTFGRYLTDEVLEEILSHQDDFSVGGERRNVAIMFADLRQSTELSEQMDPGAFIQMLNHFLGEMIEIINAWQGNILDFVGDAIVAVFGAPRVNEEAEQNAAACAVAMQRRMEAVNQWNEERGYPAIAMGIGLHTGEAILGNVGSSTRMKYDMIGRNVNLASRIQGFAEGGQILSSSQFLSAAGDRVIADEKNTLLVRPKGIREDVLLHPIIGFGSRLIPLAQKKEKNP